MLDKLYEYLSGVSGAETGDYHKDIKLRKIMDTISEQMFAQGIDSKGRGYCYGFEIYEYLKSPAHLFKELSLTP